MWTSLGKRANYKDTKLFYKIYLRFSPLENEAWSNSLCAIIKLEHANLMKSEGGKEAKGKEGDQYKKSMLASWSSLGIPREI